MTTFNFLKEGNNFKDRNLICKKHNKCCNLETKIYRLKNKIFAIYAFDDCSDRFINKCKIKKKLLIYTDGPEIYEFPKLNCKECKITLYDMLY